MLKWFNIYNKIETINTHDTTWLPVREAKMIYLKNKLFPTILIYIEERLVLELYSIRNKQQNT